MSKGIYTYEYPRPMVTVDAAVFALNESVLQILLIERKRPPFQGMWALPGGFVEIDEPLEGAAARELEEETSLANVPLIQLAAFGDVERDPRGRLITVVFVGFIDRMKQREIRAKDDAADAKWHLVSGLPPLASDHRHIIRCAVERLRLFVDGQAHVNGFFPSSLSLDAIRRALESAEERP